MKSSQTRHGYTLIELMLVVAILGVLGSIVMPRVDLLLQKAHQAKTKGNLGALRSTISLYYSELEGNWPMAHYPAGLPTESLSQILAPRYISNVPSPKLVDRVGNYNGLSLDYDTQSEYHMSLTPAEDIVILYGPQGPAPFIDRPFVYDPDNGVLYLCNDNYDLTGMRFYEW